MKQTIKDDIAFETAHIDRMMKFLSRLDQYGKEPQKPKLRVIQGGKNE